MRRGCSGMISHKEFYLTGGEVAAVWFHTKSSTCDEERLQRCVFTHIKSSTCHEERLQWRVFTQRIPELRNNSKAGGVVFQQGPLRQHFKLYLGTSLHSTPPPISKSVYFISNCFYRLRFKKNRWNCSIRRAFLKAMLRKIFLLLKYKIKPYKIDWKILSSTQLNSLSFDKVKVKYFLIGSQ